MQEHWDYVIKSKKSWFQINLKELFRYRYLSLLFVRRTFIANYKQTILGPGWAVLQPLLTTVVFTVIFGNIAQLPTDGIPPFLFYMCNNIFWTYFASCLTTTSSTFVSNANIFGKVYFPRLIIPISVVITNLISLAIQIAMFLAFYIYFLMNPAYAYQPNWMIALVPLFVLEMACLSLGFGIIISAITTKYRDLAMMVSFGVSLWMYATPIAYSVSLVPEKVRGLYMYNPMTPIIETIRYAFFGKGTVDLFYVLMSVGTTLFVLLTGIILFSKVEKTFMDTV
ncbi:MAG TPA: ABC transporter permease [Mobilitalea sp.]|nr:ABC transporter permease [Mobilitalea sp.]